VTNRFLRHLIITLVFGLTVSPARADYHYASHQGSDEYPYTTWETAAALIQDAVDAASPHDTVYIGAGEYYELIRVPQTTTHLGFIGMGIDSTYIWTDAPAGNSLMWPAAYNIIDGIHFEHRGVNSCIHATWQVHISVKNCLFNRPGYAGGGIVSLDGDMVVENCVFYSDDGSIDNLPFGTQNVRISNCFFEDRGECMLVCGAKVIIENNIGTSDLSAFFWQAGPVDTLIVGNNISFNCWVAYGLSLPSDSSILNNNTSVNDSRPNVVTDPAFYIFNAYSGKIYNNTITNPGRGFWIRDGQPDSWYDLRYNNIKTAQENIIVDDGEVDTSVIYHEFPMFGGGGDYRLQAYSPLIDAGNSEILDVDGTVSDIGAYGGPGGESYEYQDLAPLVPDSITYYVSGDSVVFTWRMNEEADFSRYLIHRDTLSGFEPSMFNLMAEPESSFYADTAFAEGQDNYYRFASVDNQDNQSDYSDEILVSATGVSDSLEHKMPWEMGILSCYPNPFNSSITIEYRVANLGPLPAQMKLEVFDVLGRKIRTLINGKEDIGIHSIRWDGFGDGGAELPSGVYFVRLSQWGTSILSDPVKVMLIR